QPAPDQPPLDLDREVGRDVAVQRGRLDVGVQVDGQLHGDRAVDGLEPDLARPVGAAERSADRAVHGLRLGRAGGLDLHVAVDGVDEDIAAETLRLDPAVHCPRGEVHVGGDADGEFDLDVVVARAHPAAVPGCALVGPLAPGRRLHRADGDAHVVLDDDDLDLIRIAAPAALDGVDNDRVPLGGESADRAVHPLDLDRLTGRDASVPGKILCFGGRSGEGRGGQGECDPAGQQALRYNPHFPISCQRSARWRTWMAPLNDSRSIRAVPRPSVTLNRWPRRTSVRVTGMPKSTVPLKVEAETVAFVPSGMRMVTLPLCVVSA